MQYLPSARKSFIYISLVEVGACRALANTEQPIKKGFEKLFPTFCIIPSIVESTGMSNKH